MCHKGFFVGMNELIFYFFCKVQSLQHEVYESLLNVGDVHVLGLNFVNGYSFRYSIEVEKKKEYII